MADKLIVIELPAKHARIMDERIAPYLDRSVKTLTARVPLHDQLRELARNAYHQGLVDGAQVADPARFRP